jgi:CheY-like chemotaxis protein
MNTTLLHPPIEIRQVERHIPFAWLRAGLDDMRAAPLPSLFYGVCFAVIGYLEDRQVCLAAGMNDHVAKPVDPDKLYDTLLSWFEECLP